MKLGVTCSVALALLVAGCAPRLKQLEGAPTTATLPRASLPPGHTHIVFRWELEDPDLTARGDGGARVSAPDSARLDFFLGGGVGAGAAVLIADRLQLQDQSDVARRLVPPPPLLWASLGRLAIPSLPDTIARVSGDTLRADVGRPTVWRVTFIRDTLVRLERVEGGRVLEWVDRSANGRTVRYGHAGQRRRLDLLVTRSGNVSGFDPEIWTLR